MGSVELQARFQGVRFCSVVVNLVEKVEEARCLVNLLESMSLQCCKDWV